MSYFKVRFFGLTGFVLVLAMMLVTGGCGDEGGGEAEATPTPYFSPSSFMTEGAFGYDSATGKVRSFIEDGTEIPPYLLIRIASAEYFNPTNDETAKCDFLITQAGEIDPASWTDTTLTPKMGFFFDWSVAQIATDCDGSGKLLDPALWGEDPTLVIKGASYGVALSGTVDSGVSEDLDEAVTTSGGDFATDWAPYICGGAIEMSASNPSVVDGYHFALGFEVDAEFNEKVDGEGDLVVMTSETVLGETFPSGAYVVDSIYGLSPLSDEESDLVSLLGGTTSAE